MGTALYYTVIYVYVTECCGLLGVDPPEVLSRCFPVYMRPTFQSRTYRQRQACTHGHQQNRTFKFRTHRQRQSCTHVHQQNRTSSGVSAAKKMEWEPETTPNTVSGSSLTPRCAMTLRQCGSTYFVAAVTLLEDTKQHTHPHTFVA